MTPHRAGRTASPAPHHSVVRPTSPTASPPAAPAISFITVTFGTRHDVIDRSIERLISALDVDGIDGEIIVVDNPHPKTGHRTGDHLALTTAGVVLIQPEHNLGFGGGNDLGVMYASADVIALVNPDLYVHDGWLPPLLTAVRNHPRTLIAPHLVGSHAAAHEAGQRVMSDGRTRPVRAGEAPHYASAACWLMQRAWYEEVGGFDPRFHPAYFEDVDFAFRSARRGGRLEIADVQIEHAHGSSTPDATPDIGAQHRAFADRWRDDLRYVDVDVNDPLATIAAMTSLTS